MKKSDIIIPSMQPNIQVGAEVVFVDGSYTQSLKDGKFCHISLGLSDDIFEVIAVNVNVPSEKPYLNDVLSYSNNCIVYLKKDNSYHFCSPINIRSIRSIDGKITLKE